MRCINPKDGTVSFVVETYQLQVKRFTLAEAEGCLNDDTGFWQTCFFVSWPVEVHPFHTTKY